MSETDAKRRAVRPRHAASVIVLRRGREGVELLMGTRAAGHRFMPNRLVFPGGGVDRADFGAESASALAPATATMLEKGAKPPMARALAIAAARELAEETGLSLGRPPALGGLLYLCRAITPPSSPIRFHARFLMVEAEGLEGALGGSGELEGLRFYKVGEALAAELPWVTARVIEEVGAWLLLPEEVRLATRPSAVFRARGRVEE
jgi:8-oxo-dGTP pyrophosphatase MutT (NUDIX family)